MKHRLVLILSLWTVSCAERGDLVGAMATSSRRAGRHRRPSSKRTNPNNDVDNENSKRGFENTPSSHNIEPATTLQAQSAGKTIYSMPALYDLAFGYRNYKEEVDFLIQQHRYLNEGKAPQRVLELAAGPARHSLEALTSQYITHATAVDNSPNMKAYAMELAQQEQHKDCCSSSSFEYICADMTRFELPISNDEQQQFDSCWILLGSLQHLTTNDDVMNCFRCIHQVLRPGGTLIVELPHPREIFSMVECTRNGWDVPLEDLDGYTSGDLHIVWGDDYDAFDPIRQIRQFTVSFELIGVGESEGGERKLTNNGSSKVLQSVKEIVPMRHFTSKEIDVLARICGFQVTSLHGALANDVDVNDEDEAFRLVCVLRKQ